MRIVSFYWIFFCAFIGSLLTAASTKAQVDNLIDLEYDKICLIDSVDLSTQVVFYRIFDLNTNTIRNVDENLATYTPLGTVKTCDQLEGFLPEKECWSETYCDYIAGGGESTGDPLNPCSGLIDSLLEIRTTLGVMPLNYPYDDDDIFPLQTDIENYLTSNSIAFDSVRGGHVYGTTLSFIDKTVEFSKVGCTSITNVYPYEVVNCVSNNYDVYRFTNGNFAIAIDENGNAVGSLPPNAVKIPCCLLCELEGEGTTANNEEEYIELCLLDSLNDGTLIRFYRVVNAVDKSYEDYSQNYTPYGVQGTVYPCELLNNNPQTVICAVANIPEHANQNGSSLVYAATTYNSLAFTVLSGSVDVTTNGVTITYPAGFSKSWTAPDECTFIANSITIDATNGNAIVGTIR